MATQAATQAQDAVGRYVTMQQKATIAYIGLGSNLADPVRQVRTAMAALSVLPQTELDACSPLYRTVPVGNAAQPDFINAVCRIRTSLPAVTLLQALLGIERAHGRVRGGEKAGPRTLDLDLLVYGEETRNTAQLSLPHPRLHERAFVLYPLAELDPGLAIPRHGLVGMLLARCAGQVIEKLRL